MTDSAGPHPSDSGEQQRAEGPLRAELSLRLGVELVPARLSLGEVSVELDGWAAGPPPVAAEIFARVGEAKGSARHKPSTDALKLALVAEHHPDARLVLAFVDERVAAPFVAAGSWRAAAIDHLGIEVVILEADSELRDGLAQAALRQFR
jgi:hypothetical protein